MGRLVEVGKATSGLQATKKQKTINKQKILFTIPAFNYLLQKIRNCFTIHHHCIQIPPKKTEHLKQVIRRQAQLK